MKRALVVALSAALLTTLFGGLASADSANTVHPQAEVVVDSPGEDAPHTLWERCRRLLGEDQLSDAAYEKCVELWKRWCKAHPRARRCPPPEPPPPCKITDVVTDRCCKVADRVTDVRRPCPEPPPPCKITDVVTDRCCKIADRATDLRPCPEPPPPCKITDVVTDRCCKIADRATDLRPCPEPPKPPPCPSVDAVSDVRCRPCLTTDAFAPCPVPTPIPIPLPIPCETVDSVVKCRPCFTDGDIVKCIPDPCLATDAAHSRLCVPPNCELSDVLIKCDPIPPSDRPGDKPVDRPTDKPADTRPTEVDRLTDRKGNDVHLRTVDADS